MHTIDTAGNVNGQFTDGNPATGVRGTRIGADWLNDLQANLFAVLAEGGIVPAKGRAEDLRDAIEAMVAGATGTGDGGVPTTRTLTTIGLVKGGGSLAVDRQFDVTPATAAEINAGIRDDAAITPAAFAQALGGALGSGSFRFGPLTIKWGSVQGNYGEGAVYTAFAEAFPNECHVAFAIPLNNSAGNTRDFSAQLVGLPNAGGFTTMLQRGGGATANTIDGFVWFALGR